MMKSKPTLSSFFIFNSTFGPKEDEELKRILFFHPDNLDVESQKIQVGLCEAVIKYMITFSTQACESLHTQKCRQIFYQPEEHFWMVMIINVPFVTKAGADGSVYYEYHADDVQPKVIQNSLEAAYRMFKLFMGPFKNIPVEDIYKKCKDFFQPYLSQMTLGYETKDVIQGIQYLPITKGSFFKVTCLIDLIEVEFPKVKIAAFLYNNRLVWNGLPPTDMLTVYRYVNDVLLSEQIKIELQGGAVAAARKHGRYISPPNSFKLPADLLNVTKIHLTCDNDDKKTEMHYFFAYRAFAATVCFTVKGDEKLSLDIFCNLDTFIGKRLSEVATTICEECATLSHMDLHNCNNADIKFILYFNRMNLAIKTSINNDKIASTILKPEVMNTIADIHADRKSLGTHGEITVKTIEDFWVTGKVSNERECYVVIQQKNANLKEISDEVKQVCAANMKGIFFYPI